MSTFRDLLIWQKLMILVTDIYQLTNTFPKEEIYGLTSQIRRCAVSIPSNIILLKDTEEMATRII